MTALFIIAGVLLFFTILLNCPVVIRVRYREDLYFRIWYLFFHYTVAPRPEPEEKQEQAPAKAEQSKKNRFRELLQKKGLSGFVDIFHEVSEVASKAGKELFSHLVFDQFQLEISVTGENAAQTALNYGYVSGAVGSAAGLFLGNVRCRSYHISVNPDFQGEKSRVVFDAKAHIRLISFLYGGLRALIRVLKVIKSLKTINNN